MLQTPPPTKKRKLDLDIHQDQPPRLDTIPTELLQQILRQLDPKSFLAAKLSSDRLFVASKDSAGATLVVTKRMRRYTAGRLYAAFEASFPGSRELTMLTCSSCCKILGNDKKGFDDMQFKRELVNRQCIQCLSKSEHLKAVVTVNNQEMFCCNVCHVVKHARKAVNENDMKSFFLRLWQPVALHSEGETGTEFVQRRCTLVSEKPICRACMETGRLAAIHARTSSEKAMKAVLKHSFSRHKVLKFVMGLQGDDEHRVSGAVDTLAFSDVSLG